MPLFKSFPIGVALTSVALAAAALSGNAFAAGDSMVKTGTKYKASQEMQGVLDTLGSLNGKPIETLEPIEARQQPTPTDAVNAILKKQGKSVEPTTLVPGVSSKDMDIAGPTGPLAVRVYTPAGAGPFPIVVYYHGGGWVIASKEVYDGGARGISKQANAIVVSVDYRLAPEAKFPAQHDDSLATYKWALANAASINGDPKRLALMGESAGGNLAIATAMAARDQGLQKPLHVVAVYPIAQVANMSTPSYIDSATAKPLNKPMMAWFAKYTLAKAEDSQDPRINLIDANLNGLPAVTLISAQIDPLRSDADLLEASLNKAGVKVEHKVYPGTTHEFFGMAAVVPAAKQAQALAGKHLREAFKTSTTR